MIERKPDHPSEIGDVIIDLSGNEDHTIRPVTNCDGVVPPHPVGTKFPGSECMDVLLDFSDSSDQSTEQPGVGDDDTE